MTIPQFKRLAALLVPLVLTLGLASCATPVPTDETPGDSANGPLVSDDIPNEGPASVAMEPSLGGSSDWKAAGEIQFQVRGYFDTYLDDDDRNIWVAFCPSSETSAVWTMAKPGNISLVSTSGDELLVVSLSQHDLGFPGIVDEVAERGDPVPTINCDLPQIWAVYFADSSRSAQPALSSATFTTDSGASATFGPAEIPAFTLR